MTDRQESSLTPSSDSLFELSFCGTSVLLRTEHDFALEAFQELETQVTGMSTLYATEKGYDGVLRYEPREDVNVTYNDEERELVLSGPLSLFGNGVAISHTAAYLAECLRASQGGPLLVHAASVSLPDDRAAYILFGEKGAGKTTLTLRLCHQFNYGFVGNDQILLGADPDDVFVQGGEKGFNVRETALRADPYLAKLIGVNETHKSAWNNKKSISPETLGIRKTIGRIGVGSFYHVRIDHSQRGLHVSLWEGIQRNLFLHEILGRHVTGQATPLLDDSGNYLGSLPIINPEESRRTRDALAYSIIRRGVTEVFSPDSDRAIDYLVEQGLRK